MRPVRFLCYAGKVRKSRRALNSLLQPSDFSCEILQLQTTDWAGAGFTINDSDRVSRRDDRHYGFGSDLRETTPVRRAF